MVVTVYLFIYIFSSRRGAISITMYNFGSPRVGNKRFAEVYNEVRKGYNYFVDAVLTTLLHSILNKMSIMSFIGLE